MKQALKGKKNIFEVYTDMKNSNGKQIWTHIRISEWFIFAESFWLKKDLSSRAELSTVSPGNTKQVRK